MRAQRAAMLGAAGTANLALQGRHPRRKSVHHRRSGHQKLWRTHHHQGLFASHPARRPDRNCRRERCRQDDVVKAADRRTETRRRDNHARQDLGRVIIDQQRSLLAPGQTRQRRPCRWGRLDRGARGQEAHSGLSEGLSVRSGLADAPIGSLSGGERSRLLLAREFARRSNLLVLDEPTNDLDLETLDLLQEVVADYEGTVLIVSHDRDFLDRTVTVTLGLDGSGKVDIVAGGYADWQRQRAPARPAPRERPKSAPPAALAPKAPRKLTYKDQRDFETLPQRIEAIEASNRARRGPAPRSRTLCAGSQAICRANRSYRPRAHRKGRRRAPLARACGNGGSAHILAPLLKGRACQLHRRPGALANPLFQDGQRHRAVLQYSRGSASGRTCAQASSAASARARVQAMCPTL